MTSRRGRPRSRASASVVLKQRQQVVVVVARQVRRAEVGQQLVRVGQLRKQLQEQQGQPALDSAPARSRFSSHSGYGLSTADQRDARLTHLLGY